MHCPSLFSHRNHVGPTRAVAAGIAVVAALACWASTAAAAGGSVRYHYTKIELPGGDRYGLVPVGERDKLGGKLTKSNLFDAFNLLKSEKSQTYGRSSLMVTGQLPDRANVAVKIDPSRAKKGFAPIIMAETVYTLTEMGVPEVKFPGHFDGGMTRADVPFYAYTLSMPLWRALPKKELTHAQIRLPDGALLSAEDFYRRWNGGDAKLRRALFSYLDRSEPFTVVRVLRLLPKLGIDYKDQVIPLLAHQSSSVRKRALSVLEDSRDDKDVLAAVLKMMKTDKNDRLARAAATFLGRAGAKNYRVYKDLYLLDAGTTKESVAAAAALGKYGDDPRVVNALYNHLSDKRPKVASAAADGLEALDADHGQMEAIDDPDIPAELRLAVARTLGADSQASSKLDGLTYVATHTTGRSAELAIRKLAELDSTRAREAVESFLSAKSRRKRLSAADALVDRGDPASLSALADAVSRGKNAHQFEEDAYALLAAQPLDAVLQKTDAANEVIKRLAYRAVGELAVEQGAGAKVFDKLKRGASSRDPAIRGASARALGAFANDDALAILKGLADDDSAKVRAGVARGLGYFDDGQMFDTVAGFLDDSSPRVVAAAVDAMRRRKEAAKWDKIKQLTAADDPRVRASALHALSQLVSRKDKQGVGSVISLLSGSVSDESRLVQLTAIRQLATFKTAGATTGIAIQLNADDPSLRVAAIEALGKTGHPSATELVLSVLQDSNPDIRRAAIVALGELEASAAEPKLKALLDKEDDEGLKSLIKRTLRKI